ncbi:uncharacterized protein [Watersipora subatra]|uniref:uncharacterized protein n=1 Tax=Watersipora subatra TaxID=2589382 RepID=UPI00355B66AC
MDRLENSTRPAHTHHTSLERHRSSDYGDRWQTSRPSHPSHQEALEKTFGSQPMISTNQQIYDGQSGGKCHAIKSDECIVACDLTSKPPAVSKVKSEPHLPAEPDHSPHQPSSSDDLPTSTSQPPSHSMSGFNGNLVIRVSGDSLTQDVSEPDVVNQLNEKLGLKVVLQLENSDGEVVFGNKVSPSHESSSDDIGYDYTEKKLFSPDSSGMEKHEPVIVNTVLNTIRELATRLGRMEQLRECPICGDKVTGYHYGVQTCESCKGFFKRTVQNKKTFKCLRNGDCEVYLPTRKKCPACRFQKCCDVGMRVEGIREDRSRGGRSTYEGATAFLPKRFKKSSESSDFPVTPIYFQPKRNRPTDSLSPDSQTPDKPAIPELLRQILALENYYEEVSTTPQACCKNRMNEGDTDKFNSMLHITEHRLYQIVKWARHLPNFLNVHTTDQVLLLQNAWAELTCLGVIWRSRHTEGLVKLSYGKTIDLGKAKEMDHEEVITRMLYVIKCFQQLKIDDYEYVALKVLALMLPDIKGLVNSTYIQSYQNTLLDALMSYTATHHPEAPLRFGELLLRLSEVQRLTAISRQQILHLQSPEMEKNSLLMELLQHQNFKRTTLTDEEALDVIHDNYRNELIITPEYNCEMLNPKVDKAASQAQQSASMTSAHKKCSDSSSKKEHGLSKAHQAPLAMKSQPPTPPPSRKSSTALPPAEHSVQSPTYPTPQSHASSSRTLEDDLSPVEENDDAVADDMSRMGRSSLQPNTSLHSLDLSNPHRHLSTDKSRKRSSSVVAPPDLYTPASAHTSRLSSDGQSIRLSDYSYTSYDRQHERARLNSDLFALQFATGFPPSLLAAHQYGFATFPAQLDCMPQDFSTGSSRLAQNYDPGGS